MATDRFQSMQLPDAFDVLAPDGSEIRVLGRVAGASMAHGTLHPGGVSLAVRHRTVEEIWFVVSGEAEIWRRLRGIESLITANAGMSITIPVGTSFQFRTLGDQPFRFVMCTSPPWPGDGEAERVSGQWPVVLERSG